MNANLRQFQAFVTVARLGSFTRAAKRLNLPSQP
jgi:DNA-binding transcriptional LysR family regulator